MDFIVTGERANTDPVFVLGPCPQYSCASLAACDVGGKPTNIGLITRRGRVVANQCFRYQVPTTACLQV